MAAPPLLPSDWQNLIPKAGEERCSAVSKVFLQIPLALFRTAEWAMNPDGTPSEELKAWIGTGTTGGSIVPQNVTATTNQNDQITVNWNLVASARSYTVSRGLTNDTASMVAVSTGITGVNYFVDTGVDVGTTYFYAVQAITTEQTSGFSNIAEGRALAETPGAEQFVSHSGTQPLEVPVPATFTKADLFIWGSGGRGGVRGVGSVFPTPGAPFGGGGGASGGYLTKLNVDLVAGDVLSLVAGLSGESSVISLLRSGNTTVLSVPFNAAMNGGDSTFGTAVTGGVGGTPSSDWSDSIPTGTPTFVQGNPGAVGTAAGGAGGAGLSGAQSAVAGAGATGTTVYQGSRPAGQTGRTTVRFHT